MERFDDLLGKDQRRLIINIDEIRVFDSELANAYTLPPVRTV